MVNIDDVCQAAAGPGVPVWKLKKVMKAALEVAAEALKAGESVDFLLGDMEVRKTRGGKKYVAFRARKQFRDLPDGGVRVETVREPGAFDVAGMYGRAVVTPPPGTAERCFKRCT